MSTVQTLQSNLARVGGYLGRIDGLAGPMTADALVHAHVKSSPPDTGLALARAIPAEWWTAYPARVAMLLAMIQAETGFWLIRENLNYTAAELVATWPSRFYADQKSPVAGKAYAGAYAENPTAIANLVYSGRDGNTQLGDGWTYRGGGWPQLTGRANYAAFSEAAGVNLELSPDQICNVITSAKVAVAFFLAKVPLASADAGDVAACRHAWNGGSVGLQVATDSFAKTQTLWGLQ